MESYRLLDEGIRGSYMGTTISEGRRLVHIYVIGALMAGFWPVPAETRPPRFFSWPVAPSETYVRSCAAHSLCPL